MNLVPFCCSLVKVMVPFSASTSLLTTARPRPWPLALVVIMGVNSLGLISSGIPMPVSLMVMVVLSFCLLLVIVSLPPLGMAWMALFIRFVRMRLRKVESV